MLLVVSRHQKTTKSLTPFAGRVARKRLNKLSLKKKRENEKDESCMEIDDNQSCSTTCTKNPSLSCQGQKRVNKKINISINGPYYISGKEAHERAKTIDFQMLKSSHGQEHWWWMQSFERAKQQDRWQNTWLWWTGLCVCTIEPKAYSVHHWASLKIICWLLITWNYIRNLTSQDKLQNDHSKQKDLSKVDKTNMTVTMKTIQNCLKKKKWELNVPYLHMSFKEKFNAALCTIHPIMRWLHTACYSWCKYQFKT